MNGHSSASGEEFGHDVGGPNVGLFQVFTTTFFGTRKLKGRCFGGSRLTLGLGALGFFIKAGFVP